MVSLDGLLASVARMITPTAREEAEIRKVMYEVSSATDRIIRPLEFSIAGSYSRGTWMKDKKEFDIFMLFPPATSREELERKGLAYGRRITKSLSGSCVVAYAEHPYTRATVKGFSVDIVPAYKVSSVAEMKSSVDRTPFHNRYLAKNFPTELAREVRLLKQFLKAGGLYGSDTRVQGFSGYLCELLMLKFRSFKSLVKDACLWEPGVAVDLESHGNPGQFRGHPLVVIDPVDPKRNVAAVVSPGNFSKFSFLCRQLLKHPSERFFFRSQVSRPVAAALGKRGTLFLGVSFRNPGVLDDIIYPQLRRTAGRLEDIMKENGFSVMGKAVHASGKECVMLFEMETWELPAIRKLTGPPLFVRKHAKEFLEKYKSGRLWVEGGNWVAEVDRKFPLAESLLRASLKGSPKELKERGIASYVAASRTFRILKNPGIVKRSRSPEFRKLLLDYLETRHW